MIRLGTWFWLMLAATTGFAMFMVKYAVQNLEDELAQVRKHTVAEQHEIRVLNAEWSYLTQPEHLSDLNRQFFALGPVTIRQLQHTLAELPLRASPPVETAEPAEPEPAPREAPIAPAVLREEADAAPPKPRSMAAAPTLDSLFAQVAGDR